MLEIKLLKYIKIKYKLNLLKIKLEFINIYITIIFKYYFI